MAGIIGYGGYIPRFRLKAEDIWGIWIDPSESVAVIKQSRGLSEKAVARWDEDAVTMAIYASKAGLELAGLSGENLNAIYFGSCTNPYTSKASALLIAESLKTTADLLCADCQFSTKSGTTALQICAGLVDGGMAKYALATGSDALSRHVAPNDVLEYSASSGAAALIIGKENVIAEITGMFSYATQTPEFFRLDGERYIKHAANENEEYKVGFENHILEAVAGYMKKYSRKPAEFNYVAISQPDGALPLEVCKKLNFSEAQFSDGLIANRVGDCGSSSALLSLLNVLDGATANEEILLISYGFGASCDVMGLKTTELLTEARRRRKMYPSVEQLIEDKEYINYSQYLKQERKIIQEYV